MWDILLTSKEVEKNKASSPPNRQTEYMGTQRTKIILHEAPIDVEKDLVGTLFTEYEQLVEVA